MLLASKCGFLLVKNPFMEGGFVLSDGMGWFPRFPRVSPALSPLQTAITREPEVRMTKDIYPIRKNKATPHKWVLCQQETTLRCKEHVWGPNIGLSVAIFAQRGFASPEGLESPRTKTWSRTTCWGNSLGSKHELGR